MSPFCYRIGLESYKEWSKLSKNNRNLSKILTNIALVSQIGISMIVMVVGGVLVGNFLDDFFGTEIIFLAMFTILGVASAFYYIFKMGLRDVDDNQKKGK